MTKWKNRDEIEVVKTRRRELIIQNKKRGELNDFRIPQNSSRKWKSQPEEGDRKRETTSDFKQERLKNEGTEKKDDCESTQGSSQNRILLPQSKEREVWRRKRKDVGNSFPRTLMRREMQVDNIPAI